MEINCKYCGCVNFMNDEIEDQICSNCDNLLEDSLDDDT